MARQPVARGRVTATVVVVCLALLATACGGGPDVSTGSGTTTGTSPTASTTVPGDGTGGRDPDEVVLTVTREGGFVPVEFLVDRGPHLVLLGDGRLIGYGPTPAIHPAPLLPELVVTRLDPATLEQVDELVDTVGFADFDHRRDDTLARRVADATTEVVTWYDPDGGTHTYSVYALGLADEGPSDEVRALAELVDLLATTLLDARDTEPWSGDGLVVFATPAPPDPDFADTRPWPLPDPPDALDPTPVADWSCTTYTGADAESLLDTFADATNVTTWEHEGVTWRLKARPLLPGETGCPT